MTNASENLDSDERIVTTLLDTAVMFLDVFEEDVLGSLPADISDIVRDQLEQMEDNAPEPPLVAIISRLGRFCRTSLIEGPHIRDGADYYRWHVNMAVREVIVAAREQNGRTAS